MGTFIEEYLHDPSRAISSALQQLDQTNWYGQVDEESIYNQLATGEFRLYEAMILTQPSDESLQSESYAAVV